MPYHCQAWNLLRIEGSVFRNIHIPVLFENNKALVFSLALSFVVVIHCEDGATF